jgi:hypothetical protein
VFGVLSAWWFLGSAVLLSYFITLWLAVKHDKKAEFFILFVFASSVAIAVALWMA